MFDPDFLIFDDPMTWRLAVKDDSFHHDMSLCDFLKLYNSKKIKPKIKKLTFDGMLTQEDLNNLLNQ